MVVSALCTLAIPGAVHAQRAAENAVTDADDAFGISVGLESAGIYTDRDTRGFSPLDAGNARIDGIYYDPVGALSGRLRQSTTIRVGFAAEGFPFTAPTGIVDYKFRTMPDEFGNSLSLYRGAFGGHIVEWDLRLPLVDRHVSLTGGIAEADLQNSDGSNSLSWGWTVRPIIRVATVEFAPFIVRSAFHDDYGHPFVVVRGATLPDVPKKRVYLGQDWAGRRYRNDHYGATLKAKITDQLSFRGGIFHSVGDRNEYYTEIFSIIDPPQGGAGPIRANHSFIADPPHEVHSTSGEALAVLRLGGGGWNHRIFAGYRARNRVTETGGSDPRSFGQVVFGELDPEPEPDFTFSAVNSGRVRQSSLMLGYIGRLDGVGQLNLGIQKARYRARFRDGATGDRGSSRADPWLYNATAFFDLTPSLSLYGGTERGLEDSGVAPENAANRSEQLPATRTTQYEGGVRWKFSGGQFVVNAFQITKPYFSFDAQNRFVRSGKERHRGVEASLSGHFGDRLSVVAGALVMQPRVTGPGVEAGLVGRRPAGKPSLYARFDANYRTDIFDGLTPTVSLVHTGKRAAGSAPQEELDGRQLMVPAYTTVDLGLRQRFKIGAIDASVRAQVQNVFDEATWKIVAANVIYPEERRRFTVSLAADF